MKIKRYEVECEYVLHPLGKGIHFCSYQIIKDKKLADAKLQDFPLCDKKKCPKKAAEKESN